MLATLISPHGSQGLEIQKYFPLNEPEAGTPAPAPMSIIVQNQIKAGTAFFHARHVDLRPLIYF